MGRYSITLPAILPPWFQSSTGQLYATAVGEVLDGELDRAQEARNARYPLVAPPDALPLLGWERRIERFYGETEAAYRGRLAHAHSTWRWAGTPGGVYRLAVAMGFSYGQAVRVNYVRWAEVYVLLSGRAIAPEERPALYRAVRAILPAHAKLAAILHGVAELWQADGLWENDGTKWGGGELVPEV